MFRLVPAPVLVLTLLEVVVVVVVGARDTEASIREHNNQTFIHC